MCACLHREEFRNSHTECVTQMYPIFDSKWFIIFSKLRHAFYTIVKQMKLCTGLKRLHFLNVNYLIRWGRLNDQRKRAFTLLFPSESDGSMELAYIPSLRTNNPLYFLDWGKMFTPLWRKWNSALDYKSCILLTSKQSSRLNDQRKWAFTSLFLFWL